ncbi:unnamed protein product [Durusdinium trenchii]|uniref:PARP catalytic domain-containing protein n=1 Tax=Durusdinium trenchii TaxID=1381693 RepID=A0ABP0MMC0_9DINO
MKSHSGGGLGHSEFIVYDPAQVRMRYLVEFNNFESPTEKYEREKAEAEARGESHPAKKLRAEEPEEPEEDEDWGFTKTQSSPSDPHRLAETSGQTYSKIFRNSVEEMLQLGRPPNIVRILLVRILQS